MREVGIEEEVEEEVVIEVDVIIMGIGMTEKKVMLYLMLVTKDLNK